MTQPREREPPARSVYRDTSRRNGGAFEAARQDERRQHEAARPQAPLRGRRAVPWGWLPGRFGVLVVIGSAAAGAFVTAVTGSLPGIVLSIFLVAGTVAAALVVHPRAGYLIFPVPAIAYLLAALVAGLIYDRSSDGSRTMLAINGTQWMASGFVAMGVATLAAIAIVATRWLRSR